MGSLTYIGRLLERRARFKGYQAIRSELDTLSDGLLSTYRARGRSESLTVPGSPLVRAVWCLVARAVLRLLVIGKLWTF